MSVTETQLSPDGRFEAIFHVSEVAKGQWIATPHVRDFKSGATIIALTDSWIDGSVTWDERPGCFSLTLRRWPDPSTGLTVDFDVEAGTVRLGVGGAPHPLAGSAALIAHHFEAHIPSAQLVDPPPELKAGAMRRLRDAAEWIVVAGFLLLGLALATGWISLPAQR